MNSQEKWQIDVGGQIYEAEFVELEQWVYEGSLLPGDMVRRGSLRWIEAGKVPALHKFFNSRESGEMPPPVVVTTTKSRQFENLPAPEAQFPSETFNLQTKAQAEENNFSEFRGFSNSLETFRLEQKDVPASDSAAAGQTIQISDICCLHTELPAFYYCDTCANSFCKACPKSYGGDVKICPACGAMCKTIKETREAFKFNSKYSSALGKGFGFGDFGRALIYPFKFKASLVFGAIFFIFFSLGQGAAAFGGFLTFAALVCYLGTNMLSFGILANMLDNFSHGITDADFMPKFDDFSIWDDVMHPFFLSIGVYLVSFGMFFALVIGGIWYAYSAATAANSQAIMLRAAELQNVKQQAQTQAASPAEPMTAESVEKAHQDENTKIQSLMKEIQQKDLASQNDEMAPTAQQAAKEQFTSMLKALTNLALPLMFCLGVSFLWGFFYFPAACAVAGYTRSFTATLNIFIGLDTIKRLGFDYVKILLMSIVLSVMITIALAILGGILKPFDLPLMGNVPLKIISGLFSFYSAIVFGCILGYAIYKNSGKLELLKG